jgi:hypothetical protein
MKKHYVGAVYDLTQKNMQNLVKQLEEKNASVSFEFALTHENKYEIECHHKAVELNMAIGDALEFIRGRLKHGNNVSKLETESLEEIRSMLWEAHIDG